MFFVDSGAICFEIIVGSYHVECSKCDLLFFPNGIFDEFLKSRICILSEQVKLWVTHALVVGIKNSTYLFQSFVGVIGTCCFAMTVGPLIVTGRIDKRMLKRLEIMVDFFEIRIVTRGVPRFKITYMDRKGWVFRIDGGYKSVEPFKIFRKMIRQDRKSVV